MTGDSAFQWWPCRRLRRALFIDFSLLCFASLSASHPTPLTVVPKHLTADNASCPPISHRGEAEKDIMLPLFIGPNHSISVCYL